MWNSTYQIIRTPIQLNNQTLLYIHFYYSIHKNANFNKKKENL